MTVPASPSPDDNDDGATDQAAPKHAETSNIPISGDDVIKNTAHLPEEQQTLLRWLYAFAQDERLGLKDIARECGIDSTTLWRVWFDKYRYPELTRNDHDPKGPKIAHPRAGQRIGVDNLCERIAKYRKLAEQRQSTVRATFIETSISKKIWQVCDFALISQTPAFLFGDTQIGKTTALEEYRTRHNHGQTKLVRMPATAGVQLFMKEMAKSCHVSPNSSFEALRDRVLAAITHRHLVIIDELHQAFLSVQISSRLVVLELIREIHDRTKCGMVLCGTNIFRREVDEGRHAPLLEQFKQRGILRVQLPAKPPQKDLDAIAKGYGLAPAEGKAGEVVALIVKESGLGKFCKYLQAAARVATRDKVRLSWEHFLKTEAISRKLEEGK